jgi:hypothetical protein
MPVVAQKQTQKPAQPAQAKPAKGKGKPAKDKPANPSAKATPEAKANGKLTPKGAPRETILQLDGTIEVYEGGKLVKRVPPQKPAKPATATPPAAKAPPAAKTLPPSKSRNFREVTPKSPATQAKAPTPPRPRLSAAEKVDWELDEKWPWPAGKPMPKDRQGNVRSFELVQHMGSVFYEFIPQSRTKVKVLKRDGQNTLLDTRLYDADQARDAWRQLRKAKFLIVGDECAVESY